MTNQSESKIAQCKSLFVLLTVLIPAITMISHSLQSASECLAPIPETSYIHNTKKSKKKRDFPRIKTKTMLNTKMCKINLYLRRS